MRGLENSYPGVRALQGVDFEELTEPEVPSKITVPATTVTKDDVDDVMELGF